MRRVGMLLAVGLLAACSNRAAPPAVSASGYIADNGVVRLWRKDDARQGIITLISVFSPFHGDHTQITHYQYRAAAIRDIQREQLGASAQEVQLRFDANGAVSFMQRQLAQRRESLSADEIARYQFDARRMLELSDSLRAGNVRLRQGIWREGVVTTCDGQSLRPALDRESRLWIVRRTGNARGLLSVAWLEAPEGTQLLLAAHANFCLWEPKLDAL
ncbi:DUF1481 domain-containing protein [Affinibrenneria salicis]|uniref:DUF1481 domain-containing protein n=1 Tax=Affinibrenneria salicis TaxID=2590031 RepID=A0A5J5FQC0_9GAMM|nr:DUF1481 domain-containing protein [Affinibrenneria salicis]KAA8995084.1 DUF1481 domain-containing protein [Affinibrenneria salicis]